MGSGRWKGGDECRASRSVALPAALQITQQGSVFDVGSRPATPLQKSTQAGQPQSMHEKDKQPTPHPHARQPLPLRLQLALQLGGARVGRRALRRRLVRLRLRMAGAWYAVD